MNPLNLEFGDSCCTTPPLSEEFDFDTLLGGDTDWDAENSQSPTSVPKTQESAAKPGLQPASSDATSALPSRQNQLPAIEEDHGITHLKTLATGKWNQPNSSLQEHLRMCQSAEHASKISGNRHCGDASGNSQGNASSSALGSEVTFGAPARQAPSMADRSRHAMPVVIHPLTSLRLELFEQKSQILVTVCRLRQALQLLKALPLDLNPSESDLQQASWPLAIPAPKWFDAKLAANLPRQELEGYYGELLRASHTKEELQKVYEDFKNAQDTLNDEYAADDLQLRIKMAKDAAKKLASKPLSREEVVSNSSDASRLPEKQWSHGQPFPIGPNLSVGQSYPLHPLTQRLLRTSTNPREEVGDKARDWDSFSVGNRQALQDHLIAQMLRNSRGGLELPKPVVQPPSANGNTRDKPLDLSTQQQSGKPTVAPQDPALIVYGTGFVDGQQMQSIPQDEKGQQRFLAPVSTLPPGSLSLGTNATRGSAPASFKALPKRFSELQRQRQSAVDQILDDLKACEDALTTKLSMRAGGDTSYTASTSKNEIEEGLKRTHHVLESVTDDGGKENKTLPDCPENQPVLRTDTAPTVPDLELPRHAIAKIPLLPAHLSAQPTQGRAPADRNTTRGVDWGKAEEKYRRLVQHLQEQRRGLQPQGEARANVQQTLSRQAQKKGSACIKCRMLLSQGKQPLAGCGQCRRDMPESGQNSLNDNTNTTSQAPVVSPSFPVHDQAINSAPVGSIDFMKAHVQMAPCSFSSTTSAASDLAKGKAKAGPDSPRIMVALPLTQQSKNNSVAPPEVEKHQATGCCSAESHEAADSFDFCDTNSDNQSPIFTPQSDAFFDDTGSQIESPVELHAGGADKNPGTAPRYSMVYKVCCSEIGNSFYLDGPTLDETVHKGHLAGKSLVNSDMEPFPFNNPKRAFVVVQELSCRKASVSTPGVTTHGDIVKISIHAYSRTLVDAIVSLAKYNTATDYVVSLPPRVLGVACRPKGPAQGRVPLSRRKVYSETFLYHHREELNLEAANNAEVALLSKFLCTLPLVLRFTWIDVQFEAGKVTLETFQFLFAPNDILVSATRGPGRPHELGPKRYVGCVLRTEPCIDEIRGTASLNCWAWSYNGESLTRQAVSFDVKLPKKGETARIADLAVYPLRYADEEIKASLMARGKNFWEELRFNKHVAYDGWCWHHEWNIAEESRFMVDYKLYVKLFPNSRWLGTSPLPKQCNDPFPESVPNTEEEIGDLALMIPADVIAFSLTDRRHWVQLRLDQVRPVNWGYHLLEPVFLPQKVKLLVNDIVFPRVWEVKRAWEEQRSQRKALTLHFQGPPGCGKTKLARALADSIKTPTYIVTAGTIGALPELWNKFVGHVHLLASAWEFVLLIEEADAFLAKRIPGSDGSFDHNDVGIISWFTKLLEELPGIVILTSNTIPAEEMHPAVRSRINLSLAFGPLDEKVRMNIWKRKWDTSGRPGELVPEDDYMLKKLAGLSMNGWEINNVFEAARDSARFYGKELEWNDIVTAMGAGIGVTMTEKRSEEQ